MADQETNIQLVGVYSGYKDVTPDAVRIDEDLECDAVVISNWTVQNSDTDITKTQVTDAATSTSGKDVHKVDGTEVYWGFGQKAVHPLYAGENSDYIFVDNLKDLWLRCNANAAGGEVRISYSVFKFQRKVLNP